jgi:Na+/H+-dicarboxylate symporter
MDKRLTTWIAIGMGLGVLTGLALNATWSGDPGLLAAVADALKLLPDVFLRLIKMIIAPLVFSTIVIGINHMGDTAALGRIGGRALGWFLCASVLSLSIGMALANLCQPGMDLAFTTTHGAMGPPGATSTVPSLREFALKVFPSSAIDAMARNDVLEILVFALFCGVGLSALGQRGAAIVGACEHLADLMLQITHYVMRFAPLAVFGALASAVAAHGVGILATFGKLVGEFYAGLALLWLLLIGVGYGFLRARVFTLLRYIREPFLIAFSTASSEAALPKLFEQLDRFGVPRRLSGFMLPLGYSFNLDGSMMYTSFAALFIAQAYRIPLSFQTQVAILLTLMVTSKGIASVPRASLVVVTATLASFRLPVEGVALILGIDQVLDMGRTGTNVIGNAIATASIARWEGMLQPLEPDIAAFAHAPAHTPDHGRAGLNLDGDGT